MMTDPKMPNRIVPEIHSDRLAIVVLEVAFPTHFPECGVDRCRPATGGLGRRIVARVDDHVRAHLDGTITIDDMAGVAGLSSYHFSRAFSRTTGETPHRYVMRSRVHHASKLLLETRTSISEVAYQTGFADQSHLTRWMKRLGGVTPAQLRLRKRVDHDSVTTAPSNRRHDGNTIQSAPRECL